MSAEVLSDQSIQLLRAMRAHVAERVAANEALVEHRLAEMEQRVLAALSQDSLRPLVNAIHPSVTVNLEPVTSAMAQSMELVANALQAVTEAQTQTATMLAKLIRVVENARVPKVEINPEVNAYLPDQPKRQLIVEHSDGTISTIREE